MMWNTHIVQTASSGERNVIPPYRSINVKTSIIFTITIALLAAFALPAHAARGNEAWQDSIGTQALNGGPSLQEILNSLGYSINVATDEVPLTVFAPPSGGTNGEVTLKYVGSASTANFGRYPKGVPGSAAQLFVKGAAPGTHVGVTVTSGDSIGFYMGPTLYDDIWYSQSNLNWDTYKHIKAFGTGVLGQYVIAWEDLPDGGDQDFNDYVVELRFQNPNELFLTFDGASFLKVCNPDTICFTINAAGGIGDLTLAKMVGSTPNILITAPSPISL